MGSLSFLNFEVNLLLFTLKSISLTVIKIGAKGQLYGALWQVDPPIMCYREDTRSKDPNPDDQVFDTGIIPGPATGLSACLPEEARVLIFSISLLKTSHVFV